MGTKILIGWGNQKKFNEKPKQKKTFKGKTLQKPLF